MRVIGIDPGYDRMGIAIVERNGTDRERVIFSSCIQTDKAATIPDRLYELGEQFTTLLEKYTPERAAFESLFFNKNQKTAMAVAEARGVAVFLARKQGLSIDEYSPQEVKAATTGYGKSDKTAVRAMLVHLVDGLPEEALDDEYDAIAVAITSLAHHR